MLFALILLFGLTSLEAQSASKPASNPDLQKVYNVALTWSKTKLGTCTKWEKISVMSLVLISFAPFDPAGDIHVSRNSAETRAH